MSLPELPACDEPDHAEISRVVQEELASLPERIRLPLVLCYLQGMTHEQAARQLHCPVGTVRSRLARGRGSLLRRITRRGLMIPAAAVASALESSARASIVPPHLSKSLIKLATRFASGSASIAGGVGVSASVAALLEGVLSVTRIQKLASLATVLFAVGGLAVVVGVSSYPAAGQTDENLADRPVAKGVRVRPFLPHSEKPDPNSYVKTYYVGDLVGAEAPLPQNQPTTSNKDGVMVTNRRWVEMRPLVDLITSTVARGTWRIHDGSGKDITSEHASKGRRKGVVASEPTGAITPFYLSISLIIRCTPDVHEEVADLLRGLRRLQNARENPGVDLEEEGRKLGLTPQAHPAGPKLSPPQPDDGKAVGPPSRDNRARIQQLLDALRQEVERLPKDRN